MLQSRIRAKQLGSAGLHANINCIDARQLKLSVNKSLSTETCFSLTDILCFWQRQSDWKVWYTETLISPVIQGGVLFLSTISSWYSTLWLEEVVISICLKAVWRLITVKQFVADENKWMNMHLHVLGCKMSCCPGPRWAGTQRCRLAANWTVCTPHRWMCYLQVLHRNIQTQTISIHAIRSQNAIYRKGSFSVTCLHTAYSCDEGRINITCQPRSRCQLINT